MMVLLSVSYAVYQDGVADFVKCAAAVAVYFEAKALSQCCSASRRARLRHGCPPAATAT